MNKWGEIIKLFCCFVFCFFLLQVRDVYYKHYDMRYIQYTHTYIYLLIVIILLMMYIIVYCSLLCPLLISGCEQYNIVQYSIVYRLPIHIQYYYAIFIFSLFNDLSSICLQNILENTKLNLLEFEFFIVLNKKEY